MENVTKGFNNAKIIEKQIIISFMKLCHLNKSYDYLLLLKD